MPYVNGVGGFFVFSEDPKRLAEWYGQAFDLSFEKYGAETFGLTFTALDAEDTSVKRQTVFSIMKAKSPIPRMPRNADPEAQYGDQPYMVNLRVDDLDATLTHLGQMGVTPLGQMDEGYGKFSWVRDPDGNRIELWQAISAF